QRRSRVLRLAARALPQIADLEEGGDRPVALVRLQLDLGAKLERAHRVGMGIERGEHLVQAVGLGGALRARLHSPPPPLPPRRPGSSAPPRRPIRPSNSARRRRTARTPSLSSWSGNSRLSTAARSSFRPSSS